MNRLYGTCLVAGAFCLLVTGMFHPVATRALSSAPALQAYIRTNTAVHALAMLGAWLSLLGIAGFSRQLGLARPVVQAGLAAYAVGVVLVCGAATMDGLVIPEILRRIQASEEARQAALMPLIGFASITASALTTVYVAAVSLAMLLWSGALAFARPGRHLAWAGFAIGGLGLAGLGSGILKLDVHGLLVVVVFQGAWFAAAGFWLAKRDPAAQTA